MGNMVEADGEGAFPLVDLMSRDGDTIASGELEMVALADEIATALGLIDPLATLDALVAEDQTANSFPRGPNGERYFLKSDFSGSSWTEVSKTDWIRAERSAGFRPSLPSWDPDYMTTCATGSFTNAGGVRGAITYNDNIPTH